MRPIRILAVATALLAPIQASAGALDSFVDRSRLYMLSSQDAAETCLAAPSVTTDIRLQNPELTRTKPRDLSGLRSSQGVLQGLAHMAYGYEIQYTLERIRSDDGYCIRVSEMEISAGRRVPQIWLKPGLSKGTCAYDVTVEHEMDHVRNYHEHLESFRDALERELPVMLEGRAYYRITSADDLGRAEERLKSETMDMVDRLHERSYEIARQKDFRMDSPAEYRRLAGLCR